MSAAEVPDLLAHGAARYPERTCVEVGGRRVSFAETSERAGRLAAVLAARGVGVGERVAVLALNELELTEIRVGVQRAGAVVVPLNYRLSERERGAIVADCDPALIIVGPDIGTAVDAIGVANAIRLGEEYEAALAAVDRPVPALPQPAERLGMLAYTSGTTGSPKGVMLTNAALHATVVAMGHEIGARPGATYLAAMPMFHVGAQVGFAFTYLGATSLQVRRFEAAEVARLLASGRITHAQLVPTMVEEVLARWDELDSAESRLERVLYGAAPMPPALACRALRSLGCELVNGYGSTEAMGISMLAPSEHRPDDRPELLGSMGRSGIGVVACVVDEAGDELPAGEVGEVVCRGPTLMSGYWSDLAASEAALRGGWLHTGDLGYRDGEGYLYLVARRHDRIVSGGENVYPQEIEDVIAGFDGVVEAGVVGVADQRWGEAICAVVVPAPGAAVSEKAVIAHCRGSLAGYKVPKRVRVVDALPRTATGKLLRRELAGLF